MRWGTPAAAVLLFAAVACDSGSMTSSPPPTIGLSVTSSQIEAAQGEAELVVANVTRGGGYVGDVTFVIDGLPDGMRAEASSLITANGVTSALLAVAVDSTVAIGNYNLAVHATASGLPDAVAPLAIVVEPVGTPVYTLETRPVSVPRGSSVTVFANIDRANSRDVPVSLSAEKLPAGVTVTLYPVTNPKALSNMTISVDPTVPPGQYFISIRGAAAALTDRVATIPLLVLPN